MNSLGIDAIAAFNAVTRVDDFAFTQEQSISHAITTFVAQNRGADNPNSKTRIHASLKKGLQLEFLYWIVICGVTLLSRKYIIRLFVAGENYSDIFESNIYYNSVA